MYSQIKKKKVSQLSQPSSLDGFFAFGMDGNNNSVKVPIELLKGNEGNDGKTPYIGENGNWWVGDIDMEIHAQGEPGKDGADGGLQIVTDGETISKDGEYLMASNGTVTISTSVDSIPQSALNTTGALLSNGSTNSTSGYYRTPLTAIPSGKTKMLVTPMSTNFGGRSLGLFDSAGVLVFILPNSDNHVPVLVDIPSNATQYILCRNTGDTYFAGFASDGAKTYTNTDKITLIKMLNGASVITELRDLIDYEKLRVVGNGETINEDGHYLFFEEGTADFIYEVYTPSEIVIPRSDLKIGGYIRNDGQLISSGSYSRTEMRDIPVGTTEFEVYSWGDGSAARVLGFYDDNEVFISAPSNKGLGILDIVQRPVGASKYVLSQNNGATYGCTIKIGGTQSEVKNENSITLVKRKADVTVSKVLRDFSKLQIKAANRPKAFLKDFLLNGTAITSNTINIVGTGTTTASQLRYKAYMTTENIYFSVVFKANADSSIRIGRTDAGSIKIDGTTFTIYAAGTSVFRTDTLPFSIITGNTYTVSCDKLDALRLRYTLSSSKGETYSVTLDKLMTNIGYGALGWGTPFFGVINGDVTVKNTILSFVYDLNTLLSIYGDSFIEGNSLLSQGGISNKWSSLLGDKIGSLFVHISGKGGEVASTAFVNRFKVENSLFKSPYVILAFGTNHSSLDSYTTPMQQLIEECRLNGQVPILQTIPPRSSLNYTTVTKPINDWVKASGELYIDFHAALTKPDDETAWISDFMMSDGTHPTVSGQLAMFEQVKRVLSFLIV